MRAAGSEALSRRAASRPPITGISISRTTTSGCNSPATAKASWPFLAVPTTLNSGCSMRANTANDATWSSAITTRTESAATALAHHAGASFPTVTSNEAKLVRKRPNLANGHDRDEGTMHRSLEVELRRNLLAEVLVAHQRE